MRKPAITLKSEAERIARIRQRKPRTVEPSVLLARGLLVRALRHAGLNHVLTRQPCAFGIVGVKEGEIDAVSSAVRDILRAPQACAMGYDVSINDRTGVRRKPSGDIHALVLDAARGGDRLAVLYSDHEAVPAVFLASAEGVVEMGPPDPRLLRGVFMATMKSAPGPEGLALVASVPIDLLDSVIVPGRSMSRCLEVARQLLAVVSASDEVATSPPPAETGDGPLLRDLSGLDEAVAWGTDLAVDLAEYRAGRLAWSDVDKGLVLAGPPGVGKTMYASALGRTCGIPVHLHSCAKWQSKGHLGDLLKAMASAFDEARRAAPVILFLDELDSFGSRDDPGDRYAAYSRQVIDALLEQLDGATGRPGVIALGATNRPELVDEAILRPGRMERVVVLPLPDHGAREGILRHHLRGDLADAVLTQIADRMTGATGASIEMLVRDARRRARKRHAPLAIADVEAGLPQPTPMSESLLRRVCVHEGAHWVIGGLLADESGCDPVDATVDGNASEGSAGSTSFRHRAGFDRTRGSFLAEITVLLAGLAAEEEIIGTRGDGAGGRRSSDIGRATDIATALEVSLGLGGALVYRTESREGLATALAGDPDLRLRVAAVLDECFGRARKLVASERHSIERTAARLRAGSLAASGATQGIAPTP